MNNLGICETLCKYKQIVKRFCTIILNRGGIKLELNGTASRSETKSTLAEFLD